MPHPFFQSDKEAAEFIGAMHGTIDSLAWLLDGDGVDADVSSVEIPRGQAGSRRKAKGGSIRRTLLTYDAFER